MRALIAALALWAVLPAARPCDCFPPELRAKTAQDALDLARVAVYARVVEVAAGRAKAIVLESFKGPPPGTTLEIAPATAACEPRSSVVGEEALVLSFQDTITACDQHSPEHYLLATFRTLAAQPRP
jgi:hypothetical protein